MNGKLPDSWIDQPSSQAMLSVDSVHDVHWRTYGNQETASGIVLAPYETKALHNALEECLV